MTQELSGKVAIVTGGASGIGRGTVDLFVEEGAQVVVADLDQERGEELVHKLGRPVRFKKTDVSRREDMQALVDFAVAEFGGLHIMFNNAGLSDNAFGPLLDMDFDAFDRIMRVNVLGVMLGTQIAGRHMAQHGGGSIINNASIGGVVAGHGFSIYRASKAGVILFTKVAAIELGVQGIRVNSICPGNIMTDMGVFAAPEPGMTQDQADRLRAAISDARLKRQALKRQGTARDIAQTAVFLGSDRSQQMTGQTLSVDAGATAGDPISLIQEIMEIRESAL